MNVLFHLAVGTSIIASNSHFKNETKQERWVLTGVGFVVGLLSHGILDYIPHCYPINSKLMLFLDCS